MIHNARSKQLQSRTENRANSKPKLKLRNCALPAQNWDIDWPWNHAAVASHNEGSGSRNLDDEMRVAEPGAGIVFGCELWSCDYDVSQDSLI